MLGFMYSSFTKIIYTVLPLLPLWNSFSELLLEVLSVRLPSSATGPKETLTTLCVHKVNSYNDMEVDLKSMVTGAWYRALLSLVPSISSESRWVALKSPPLWFSDLPCCFVVLSFYLAVEQVACPHSQLKILGEVAVGSLEHTRRSGALNGAQLKDTVELHAQLKDTWVGLAEDAREPD